VRGKSFALFLILTFGGNLLTLTFKIILFNNEPFKGYNTLIFERGEKVDAMSLIKKAKQGDKEALIDLVMDKKQEYYKLAYVYMKNSEDALDAMEDMIVILYENIHKLKKEEAFYSWSKTILVNCCKNTLRKSRKVISLEDIKEEVLEYYTENIEEKNQQIIIEEYMSKLNEKHQEVIKLRYFLDLDYNTIAGILKIPIGTVKSRISIGLQRLKECFGGEEA
jgi:RNA polymerase sigma-70 factor (ECF subfamily)